jgi:hypothetical protein
MGTARAVVVQPDRKILVGGQPARQLDDDGHAANPDGTPDTALGGDGTATIDFGDEDDVCNAIPTPIRHQGSDTHPDSAHDERHRFRPTAATIARLAARCCSR